MRAILHNVVALITVTSTSQLLLALSSVPPSWYTQIAHAQKKQLLLEKYCMHAVKYLRTSWPQTLVAFSAGKAEWPHYTEVDTEGGVRLVKDAHT